MKNIRCLYLKNCNFSVVKFSIYLNRRVFVMHNNLPYTDNGCNAFSLAVILPVMYTPRDAPETVNRDQN